MLHTYVKCEYNQNLFMHFFFEWSERNILKEWFGLGKEDKLIPETFLIASSQFILLKLFTCMQNVK